MQSKIIGTNLPVLELTLEPGDKIVAAPDQLSWMSGNISLNTTTATGGSSGLWGAVGRALGGGGLFMTEFTAQGGRGFVAMAAKLPGTFTEVEVSPGRSYMIHRHGFVAGTHGVELATGFQQSLGSGLFGGDGFILQRLSGTAKAWVELGGELVSYTLEPGQDLLVHPGHVGMFEEGVGFEITTLRGIKTIAFGGDGLFLARLSGPGRVWLQSLTPGNLAHAVEPYLPRPH
ncbi:uncharacterized protein (TIGR00266 family) [Rhodoligotrophos appendicifer]|uniref:TIGR00266 family protein n=1 Tax=Rhodoligotrophos appendicifer TaxID=987056 RepID=UPI00118568F3|nr:TIGR00266 family protein [Rhodoligotrophos appendicifer]